MEPIMAKWERLSSIIWRDWFKYNESWCENKYRVSESNKTVLLQFLIEHLHFSTYAVKKLKKQWFFICTIPVGKDCRRLQRFHFPQAATNSTSAMIYVKFRRYRKDDNLFLIQIVPSFKEYSLFQRISFFFHTLSRMGEDLRGTADRCCRNQEISIGADSRDS